MSFEEFNEKGRLVISGKELELESPNEHQFVMQVFSPSGSLLTEYISTIEIKYNEEYSEENYREKEIRYYDSGQKMQIKTYYNEELEQVKWYDTKGNMQGKFIYKSDTIMLEPIITN